MEQNLLLGGTSVTSQRCFLTVHINFRISCPAQSTKQNHFRGAVNSRASQILVLLL